jgi:transcription initiation factor TFIIB
MGLAAAALYIACVLEGENKTQKDVADAAAVTEVTIRNRYKGLKAALHL